MVKNIIKVLTVITVVLLIIFARTYYYQQKEFAQAEKDYVSKDIKSALVHYESAILMYTPSSSAVKTSTQRMLEIAELYEKKGEYKWAFLTYQDLRGALLSVRSFYSPYPEIVATCDKKIEQLFQKID